MDQMRIAIGNVPPMAVDDDAEYLACGLENMIVIGDSARDLESALAVGATPILVRTGKGSATEKQLTHAGNFQNLEVYDDLATTVDALLTSKT